MTHNANRRRHGAWVAAIIILIILLFGPVVALATDWLWYHEMGRTDVFWTMMIGPWVPGLAAALLCFVIVFLNVGGALRATSEAALLDAGARFQLPVGLEQRIGRGAMWAVAAATLVFSVVLGGAAAAHWQDFLLFAHARPMGQTDPIFGLDVSFYLFRLPVWRLLLSWVTISLAVAMALAALIYLLTRAIRTTSGGMPVFSGGAQTHLSALLALVFLTRAAAYYLARYSLLYHDAGKYVGAGYADIHSRLPALNILIVVCIIAALAMLFNMGRRSLGFLIGTVVVVILLAACVRGVYPALVQRFVVEPNELEKELPYLKFHIDMTCKAFGLDAVPRKPMDPLPRVSAADIAASPVTAGNIRLWDYRPLQQVYKQRQELRPYYKINDVDIDRYIIAGQRRQVMIAAREMNDDSVPQQTWVNRHLIYTHGYGVVMSPVNAVDQGQGEPDFLVRDIPPVAAAPEVTVSKPGIYFGELASDYCVVHTAQPEFDYPKGDDNATTQYAGNAGIPLGNPLTRLLMAARFGDLNLLISSYLTSDSRLLMRRQLLDRVKALAPFLSYAKDPYIVVGTDGGLYWIVDAFTSSDRYPYARSAEVDTGDSGTLTVNYLRNPVKVVVNAYNGTVGFYVVDPNEPFIRAWGQVFPGLFHPVADMPAGLRQHVRVPEEQFLTLSQVYRSYHMTDPTTFYAQEDLWDIPQETVSDDSGQRSQQEMEAYYVTMSLPGNKDPEYLIIRPYVPTGKKNMIAWLSARCDADHLGELLVYDFPKQSLVYGPEQVQARANQDSDISAWITLRDTSGSKLLFGNLLVIPIGGSVLYVEPIYLQAEQSQIPELQQVMVADQGRVVMRPSLEEALNALTSGETPASAPATNQTQPAPAATTTSPDLAAQALDHYQKAQAELDAMKKELEELSKPK